MAGRGDGRRPRGARRFARHGAGVERERLAERRQRERDDGGSAREP